MKHPFRHLGAVAAALFIGAAAPQVFAHGDVTPQAVDTTGLKNLGADFLKNDLSTLFRTHDYAAFFMASKTSGASFPLAE